MSGSKDAIEQGRGSAAPDIQAGKKEDNAESAEKTTAYPGIALETGHRQQDEPDRKRRNNEGGEKANGDEAERNGNGGVDGCIEAACPEIVHVSRSLMQAGLLVVLLAMTAATCGPVALWFAGFAFVSLAVFLTVFYVAYRRWGNHSGVVMDMTQTVLALLVTALALLVSGNVFGGLLIAGVAVGLCGAVAGTWLAMLAARTSRTFRQALAAVFDPKGSRSWSLAR